MIGTYVLAEQLLVAAGLASVLRSEGHQAAGETGGHSRIEVVGYGSRWAAARPADQAPQVLVVHLGTIARAHPAFLSEALSAIREIRRSSGACVVVADAAALPDEWGQVVRVPVAAGAAELRSAVLRAAESPGIG